MRPARMALMLMLASALPGTVAAQVMVGLHGGLARSALVMDSGDSEFRGGLVGGAWLRLPLASSVGLQFGAYYAQKGATWSADAGNVSATVELSYFEFPVAFALLLNRDGPVRGNILAGGSFAVERDCRIGARSGTTSASVDCEEVGATEVSFYSEAVDAAFVLGGGLEFDQGPVVLTLDVRAHFGLLDAFHANIFTATVNEDDGGQNLHLGLLAGVAFPLGPRPVR